MTILKIKNLEKMNENELFNYSDKLNDFAKKLHLDYSMMVDKNVKYHTDKLYSVITNNSNDYNTYKDNFIFYVDAKQNFIRNKLDELSLNELMDLINMI